MNLRIAIAAVLIAALPAFAQQPAWSWDDGTVPYVQTPMEIVERMLRMAEVKKDDYVIDLGSGDGRIIIEAAKRGARGLGVDLDPNLVKHDRRYPTPDYLRARTLLGNVKAEGEMTEVTAGLPMM